MWKLSWIVEEEGVGFATGHAGSGLLQKRIRGNHWRTSGALGTENLIREFNRRNPNKPRDGRLTIVALELDKGSVLSL